MPPSNDHDPLKPDTDFTQRLEREILSQVRRARSFQSTTPPRQPSRALAVIIAAVAVSSIAIGATGTLMMTSQTRGDARLALTRAQIALELARESESFVLARSEEAAQSSESEGDTSNWSERRINATERRQLLESQLREVILRRASPIDSITADRPGGRDYVRKRLSIRLEAAQERQRLPAGIGQDPSAAPSSWMPPGDVLSSRLTVSAAGTETLKQLIDLRDRFNDNLISAQRAELEAMRLMCLAERQWCIENHNRAAQRLSQMRQMEVQSDVPDSVLHELEHELRMATIRTLGANALLDAIDSMLKELSENDTPTKARSSGAAEKGDT